MFKIIFRLSVVAFALACMPNKVLAGTTVYVPIGIDPAFFIPVNKVECLQQDVCVTWITQGPNIIVDSGFSDDPGFNYSDDTNKRHQLSTLYYNSQTFSPIKLQCLSNSDTWVDITSPGNSPMSVINSTDGYGQPLNLNYNAINYPVYQHRWPGTLLVNATNCKVTTADLYAPTTDAYTYKHRQKWLSLRMVNPDGSTAVVMPPSLDGCRLNNWAPNLWDRSLSCVGSSRPSSIELAVDETITRASNYANLNLSLNFNTGIGGDYWKCSYSITVDGVSKGNWGNPSQATSAQLGALRFGAHSIGFSVIQCFANSNCQGPAAYCQNVNSVAGNSQPLTAQPQLYWHLNPSYQGEQKFNFTLQQPSP